MTKKNKKKLKQRTKCYCFSFEIQKLSLVPQHNQFPFLLSSQMTHPFTLCPQEINVLHFFPPTTPFQYYCNSFSVFLSPYQAHYPKIPLIELLLKPCDQDGKYYLFVCVFFFLVCECVFAILYRVVLKSSNSG